VPDLPQPVMKVWVYFSITNFRSYISLPDIMNFLKFPDKIKLAKSRGKK